MKQDTNDIRSKSLDWFKRMDLSMAQFFYLKYESLIGNDRLVTDEIKEQIYKAEHPLPTDLNNTVSGEDLVKENEKLKRLLHDLTPGGSEFYNDPEYCAKWIREERLSTKQELTKRISENKKEIERLSASNKELVEVVRECYGYFSAPNFTDRYGTAERLKTALQNNTIKP